MNRLVVLVVSVCSILVMNLIPAFGAEGSQLVKLKGEVLEVEELKEPLGNAIYTVKDLASGQTVKLLADKYRSLLKNGGQVVSAGDVLGGSKLTVIYQKSPDQNLPEIVFAKITNSYT